jgi:glycosyltransferase involved in cell wall biosynthesis
MPTWNPQANDIFLDALPEADRKRCLALIRENCRSATGFICTSNYYADYMATYLGISRERMRVVYPGICQDGAVTPELMPAKAPPTIGYFARICPEKGFHNLIDAYIRLRQLPGSPPAKLKIGGWLGENYRAYFEEQYKKLVEAGYESDFERVDCPTHEEKMKFFQSLDVFSVPTDYHEPKGLYLLEAWANGVPVVQPHHGSFPELIEATQGGLLVTPGDPSELAQGLLQLLTHSEQRITAGLHAQAVVRERFSAQRMATEIAAVLEGAANPIICDSVTTRS